MAGRGRGIKVEESTDASMFLQACVYVHVYLTEGAL